ncbi:MAG: hypothetical protein AAF514_11695, partial [Verrucomicrobiota bacterium]
LFFGSASRTSIPMPVPSQPLVVAGQSGGQEVGLDGSPPSPEMAATSEDGARDSLNPAAKRLDELLQDLEMPDGDRAAALLEWVHQHEMDLRPEDQADGCEQALEILADENYGQVYPVLLNTGADPDVHGVIMHDLLARPESVKLPALVEVAKAGVDHPVYEEAVSIFRETLEEDHGNPIAWQNAVMRYLRKKGS